jgi:hypothetical protein
VSNVQRSNIRNQRRLWFLSRKPATPGSSKSLRVYLGTNALFRDVARDNKGFQERRIFARFRFNDLNLKVSVAENFLS